MACEGAVWLARVQCGTRGTGDSSRSGVCAGSLTPGILDTRRLSPRQGCESGRQPCAGQRSSSPGRRRPRESASGVPGTGRGACQCPDAIAVFLSLVGKLANDNILAEPAKTVKPRLFKENRENTENAENREKQGFSAFSPGEDVFHENSVFSVFFHVFSDFAHQGRFSRKRGFWPVFACFPHFPRARMRTRRVPVACAPRASYVFK